MCPENVLAVCSESCVCVLFFSYFFKVVIGRGGSKRIRKEGESKEKKRAAGCVGYSRLELGLGLALGQRAI